MLIIGYGTLILTVCMQPNKTWKFITDDKQGVFTKLYSVGVIVTIIRGH